MSIRTTIKHETLKVTVVREAGGAIERPREVNGPMIAAAPARPVHLPSDERVATTQRFELVDSIRGFALLGVFWANLLIFSGIEYMTTAQRASLSASSFDRIAYFCMRFFIENKFMGLFSFLFGISFWLFLKRAHVRVSSPTLLFYRRIFWLFVIGLLHGYLLWCFDILRFYALWAVLLPLFIWMKPRKLLAAALSAAVLVPAIVAGLRVWLGPAGDSGQAYDAMALFAFANGSYRDVLVLNWKYDWYLTLSISQIGYQVAIFGRLLLGLYVARTFDFGNLGKYRRLLVYVLVFGAVWGLAGSTVHAARLIKGPGMGPLLAFIRELIVEGGQLGLTLAYASALAFGFLSSSFNRLVRAIAPLGRMALSWYLLQTVFGIWLCYGFTHGPALMGKLSPGTIAVMALTGYLLQVVLARLWLSRFRFGPAEWLWRTLTYWKPQPFRVRAAEQRQT
ncbi:MAG TPA: DUF418 domain-containing protein [Pyrinomonadaceae bacterium]|nr:DUF418 domain-containing protein [Pyrinomonadaceae bacterium]